MLLFAKQKLMLVILSGVFAGSILFTSQAQSEKIEKTEKEKKQEPPKLKRITDKTPDSPQKEVLEEPESARTFRRDLILQINEIVKKIQNNYPILSKKLSPVNQKEILKSLVQSLNHGMKYVDAKELDKKNTPTQNNKVPFPALMISSNQILYIRIDSFSKKTLEQLKIDCKKSAKFAEKNIGIIIDLRNSQGNDDKSALNSAALFVSKANMDKFNFESSLRQILKQPAILLIGEKTRGASEIFAKILIKTKRAISLGEKSAGVPFKKKRLRLINGDYLLIPQIPEHLKQISTAALKPSIISTPYPKNTYKKLKNTPGSEKSDKCIQRAVELIKCLHALKK